MSKNNTSKEIIKNLLSIKNIIIYIIAFMISTLGMGQEVSPFSIAIVGACLAGGVPAIMVVVAGLIGNIVGVGTVGALNYILIILMLLILICIKPPKENDQYKNEEIQIAGHIFVSIVLVMIAKLILTKFTVADLLLHITLAVFSVVFYKIFVNSLVVIQEITEKRAFSIEEVMGASLLISIAVSALGDFAIFGFSVKNIISILMVLILGWKNGVLVGTTAGVTIGVTLGIITQNEPIIVAVYALSGMISGLLNRFGKVGVIVGFLIGNGILMYASKNTTSEFLIIKEALIASLGLLAIPKWAGINIKELVKSDNMLPEYNKRGLEQSKETINQLNMVSETIKDMADTYKEKGDTDLYFKNRDLFITELLNNLDGLEENMLYEDMTKPDNEIVKELFDVLLDKQEITREDLLKTFAKFNNYIVQYDDEKISKKMNNDIEQVVKAVNYAYKVSKVNFIWEEKVSIAVKMEEDIKKDTDYDEEKKKVITALGIKNILIDGIEINKQENRYFIDVYLSEDSKTSENIEVDKIQKVLEKSLNEKLMKNDVKNKKSSKQGKRVYSYLSADKYIIQIGQATKIKNDSPVSGDSLLQIRLNDGKYLLAISDGMGSGPEARKSSQIALKMLERLFLSGFDKNTAIDLINTTIMNANEEIFATLDITIVDLYNGKMEFIKNGACPTYIKNKKKVQIVKSLSLPAGILKDINLTTYDKDIENQDIIVMCSDGILDSNVEYKNKELWVKYVLEDIETTNSQKIADLILNEAVDNSYGIAKDDMSVITCKFIKSENL